MCYHFKRTPQNPTIVYNDNAHIGSPWEVKIKHLTNALTPTPTLESACDNDGNQLEDISRTVPGRRPKLIGRHQGRRKQRVIKLQQANKFTAC